MRSLRATKEEIEISIVSRHENRPFAHLVILPGIGNFGSASEVIKKYELDHFLIDQVEKGSFVLGVCLGMQLLGDSSSEAPDSTGLGFIAGKSIKLLASHGFPVPHVGWNSLKLRKMGIMQTLDTQSDFYFTHSYQFEPSNPTDILTETKYGKGTIVSAVQKNNVFGFQFHPEKSGNAGDRLVSEIIKKSRNEI